MSTKVKLQGQFKLLLTFESNLKIQEFNLIKFMEMYKNFYKTTLKNLLTYTMILKDFEANGEAESTFNTPLFSHHKSNKPSKSTKNKSTLYIVLSPERLDDIAKASMKKMGDFANENFKETDLFITIGNQASDLVLSRNLSVIKHYDYKIMLNEFEFANNMSSIIYVSALKGIVSDVIVVNPQVSKGKLSTQNILPFELGKWEEYWGSKIPKDEFKTIKKEAIELYDEIKSVNFQKVFFEPQLENIISQQVVLLIRMNIEFMWYNLKFNYYQQEYQILQTKKDNIDKSKNELQVKLQKIRKDEITSSILVLAAAKLTQKDDEEEDYE